MIERDRPTVSVRAIDHSGKFSSADGVTVKLELTVYELVKKGDEEGLKQIVESAKSTITNELYGDIRRKVIQLKQDVLPKIDNDAEGMHIFASFKEIISMLEGNKPTGENK